MSKIMSSQPASDILDVAQLFFVNMSLLGFDAAAMERKCRIPFNKDMFALPNKKGFEIVIYFLFNRLDASRCREMFRDCWPITDKKQEQQFRKVCTHWLEQIVKDDPDSYLPRIGASLFMSPGGDKFYQFLFCFSRYVMLRIIVCEHGARSPSDFPCHPQLTPSNSSLAVSLANAVAASGTVLQQRFIKECQQLETLQNEWVAFADELTKEYRSLVRHCRDLEHDVRTEMHRMSESKLSAGNSPRRPRHPGGSTEYDHDIKTVLRAQAVQQVRGLWKSVEEFRVALSTDKEVVESILHRTVEKHRLDATEMSITLPDLLLRECEQEIQRRNVENVYKEGKVNLLSLIHLWNLSLHLYIEKMHEVGLPHLDEFITELQTMLQTHRSHLSSAECHKKSLEFEILPEIKNSVDQLKEQRNEELMHNAGHRASLGLSLLPPTPPVSFEPQDGNDRHRTHSDLHLRLKQSHDTTPDGASQLLVDVDNKLRRKHDSSIVQGQPIYGPRTKELGVRPPTSRTVATQQLGIERRQDDHSSVKPLVQPHRSQNVPSAMSYATNKPTVGSQANCLPATKTGIRSKFEPSATSHARTTSSSKVAGQKHHHQSSRKTNVSVDRHHNVVASSTVTAVKPTMSHVDLLVDRVVSSVMTDLPENDDYAGNDYQFDPVTEMGTEMFQPGDKIRRTPPSPVSRLQSDNNPGPLSSTHIDSGSSGRSETDQPVVDPVAIRLFDPPSADTPRQSPNHRGEEVLRNAGEITPLHSDGSPPSSIHSVSTHDASNFSGDDHLLSILDSIDGRTRERVLSAGKGTQECDDAVLDLGLDCLDETIQSLLDSKTPMLPARVRSAIGFKSTVSTHCDLEKNAVASTSTRSYSALNINVGNHLRYETRSNSQIATSSAVEPQAHVIANTAVKNTSSSQQPGVEGSSKPLESLADLDSLIARYRNLRAAAPEQSASSTDVNSNVKLDTSCLSGSVSATVPAATDLSNSKNMYLNRAALHSTARANGDITHGLLDGSALFNLSSECGLDNDEFEDIHRNLVDISLDDDLSSSLPYLQQEGTTALDTSRTLFHTMPLSPFTDAVHRTSHVQSSVVDPTRFEVTSRISDSLCGDILKERSRNVAA